jgi:hypothetical protein
LTDTSVRGQGNQGQNNYTVRKGKENKAIGPIHYRHIYPKIGEIKISEKENEERKQNENAI